MVALLVPLATMLAGCNREAPPSYAPPPPTVSQPAYAPPSAAPNEEKLATAQACASDIQRLCSGVPPRQWMIKQCMKSHVSELSAGCFDKEANWLPAPAGKLVLMLRMYWPNEKDPSIIDGSWKIPAVTRV